MITAKAGDKSDFITISIVAKTIPVTGISLNPSSITLKVGESQTITADVTPQNATDKNVTWESSNQDVASVNNGTVTGLNPGSVTITATTVNGNKTADCSVTIKPNLAPSVTIGADYISAVSAVLSGEANLETSGSSDLTMGIMLSTYSGVLPSNSTKIEAIQIDAKDGFEASYSYYVDATGLEPETIYYYRSYVTQNGQDAYGETKSFTTKDLASLLTTLNATSVTATSATLNGTADLSDVGVAYKTIEYGFYWGTSESDQSTKLRGGNITGNAYSASLTNLSHKTQYWYRSYVLLDGQTLYGDVKSFTTDVVPVESISLDNTEYTFHSIGKTLTLIATVLPSDATDKSLEWSSDKEDVATVDSNGIVTAKGNGNATITVKTKDQGKVASCEVTVAQWITSISLFQTTITLNEGQELTLTPTVNPSTAFDKTINWTSSNESAAIVDNNGKVTAVSKGTATIKAEAKDGSGVSASCSLTVIRPVSSINLNKTSLSLFIYSIYNKQSETLTASVIPSDASNTAVTWSSSNASVVSVSNTGEVTSISKGTATITVTANDGNGASATCEVEVKQFVTSIILDKNKLDMIIGEESTLSVASILPENANDKTYSWTTSDNSVASVDANGKVIAKSVGKATIKAVANDGGGCGGTCSVVVSNPCPVGAVDMGTHSSEGYKVYWATSNLSTSGLCADPVDYGDHYAWGETEPKTDYSWSTYKWCNGSKESLTKYNTKSSYGRVDKKTVLYPEDDAAHVKLGGSWRIPTDAEWTELRNNCTWEWTSIYNGNIAYGMIVRAPNGNSIFLPAVWVFDFAGSVGRLRAGYYWSSSICSDYPYEAYILYFASDATESKTVSVSSGGRYEGYSIRPVCDE